MLTDSAFSSTASTLSRLSNSELGSVLSGHAINGTFYSPQLTSGQTAMNFAGQTLTVTGSTVSLAGGNTANILTSDFEEFGGHLDVGGAMVHRGDCFGAGKLFIGIVGEWDWSEHFLFV
ncbi:hypothetical protein BJ138DRAFT_1115370 [Hygrophoropsis aurantiaca]|uniref:Uncharacterized protein n=1 Tax=Hygrophoropsis aurantiaca TaxID=72124 RepID=A0ACB8A6A8_9AGAM|nr:hypothetical protein BJ138DRAFT_1115370 [Hygrophoropsis aurantiaca]